MLEAPGAFTVPRRSWGADESSERQLRQVPRHRWQHVAHESDLGDGMRQ